MKTKNKRTYCLFVTPLSIDDCLLRLEAMAEKDLAIDCLFRSDHQAEVQLTERRNDDLPLSITALLRTRNNGTCVTLTRPPSTERKAGFFELRLDRRYATPHVVWVVAALFMIAGIINRDPRYVLSVFSPSCWCTA